MGGARSLVAITDQWSPTVAAGERERMMSEGEIREKGREREREFRERVSVRERVYEEERVREKEKDLKRREAMVKLVAKKREE